MMRKLVRAFLRALVACAALGVSASTSGTTSTASAAAASSKELACQAAIAAEAELLDIRHQNSIYEHVQDPGDLVDAKKRSSSGTWACAEALFNAEKYAMEYRNALQELLPPTEAMAEFSHAHCGEDHADIATDEQMVAHLITRYTEAKSHHDTAERHLEHLLERSGELCTDSAEGEFDEALHDEL